MCIEQNSDKILAKSKANNVSSIIKSRIIEAGASFFANDSIWLYIKAGELELLKEELTIKIREVLDILVIDIDYNTKETANRIAKKYIEEIFQGRYTAPPKLTEFPNFKKLDEIYTVGPIVVRSTCSHHFSPILGQLWV